MNTIRDGETLHPRVLVVDDDRLVLATLVHGLTQAGFDVIDADNGDEAILLARQERPDLALLDIRMDGMSGFDVASYLREHLRIPFVFLSAFSDEATVAQIRALGALAYLVKPLDVGQIVPVVRAAVDQARARNEGSAAGAPRRDNASARVSTSSPPPSSTAAPTASPIISPPSSAAREMTPIVAMAVGIVMHRWSLSQGAAMQRLERLAEQEKRPLEAACAGVVAAVEQLAAAGAG